MPIRALHATVLLAVAAFATACHSTRPAYRPDPVSLATPAKPAQDDKRLYLALIAQMQQQGAYYASLAHVDAYRQRHGDSAALRLLQADALRATGQLPAARTLYVALANGPQAAAAWHGLGLIAVHEGDPAQAEQCLARAVTLEPLNTDYLGDLGFARLRAGQREEAREPLARAAELAPDKIQANANMALWALLSNETALAERILHSAGFPEATRQEVRRLAVELGPPAPASSSPERLADAHLASGSTP